VHRRRLHRRLEWRLVGGRSERVSLPTADAVLVPCEIGNDVLVRLRLGPPSLWARQMVPAASLAQAPARTPGLGWPTVAIRCAESGDLNLSRRRCATHPWLVRRSKRLCGSGREEHYALLRTWLKCQSLRVQGSLEGTLPDSRGCVNVSTSRQFS
jgi:hypothetical protein